ncbi:MAG: hypothetical protein IJ512_03330 [Ruminococcus sp.]|nr:hypothetical protein [Ruminococcus sp.]
MHWKRSAAWVTAAVCMTVQLSVVDAAAAVVQLVPVEKGIALSDRTGQIYIHVQSQDALHVTVDKTEPEGIFRYYDAELTGAEGQTETVYQMDLSRCEYQMDTGEYASQYTVSIAAADDIDAVYTINVVVQDPDFEAVEGNVYHFYISLEESKTPGFRLQSSQESTEQGVQTCRQILVLQYRELIQGDADRDGTVALADASEVLRCYAAKSAGIETKIHMKAADVDQNDAVDLADASCILVYYAKMAAGMTPAWEEIIL